VFWQRHRRERARITAYQRALRRLDRLESRNLPSGTEISDWYVELSDIVRRFLEDQYGVRAPELTTEEFLQEAQRSAELSATHRDLLSAFLERCDRVKFAAYSPDQNESRESLAIARRFLEEARVVVEAEPQPAV
jgi:predicted nucleic acid-binding protein